LGIKGWHVIVFSFVPLAMLFIGALSGAFRGVGASEQELAPPPPPPGSEEPRPTPGANETLIEIAAENVQFSSRAMEAAANSEVTIAFENNDTGVLHNIAIYDSPQAQRDIFIGEPFAGPASMDYKFTAPAAGAYFFRCDVHPDQMTGTFNVK
jgi:plastocyanin